MLPERCDCCNYEKFYIKPEFDMGNSQKYGLYCQRCGKFLKVLNKKEQDICKINKIPTILYGRYRDIF